MKMLKALFPVGVAIALSASPALAADPTPSPKPLPIKGVTVDVHEMDRNGAQPGAASHIERPPMMMRQFRAPAAAERAAPAAAPVPTPTPTPTPVPGRR